MEIVKMSMTMNGSIKYGILHNGILFSNKEE
jgi:hypothetical protein